MTNAATNRVIKSIDVPGGSGTVVVYDWMTYTQNRAENLELLSPEGVCIWRAKLPTAAGVDCFTDIAWDADCLRASTWSGWTAWLNPRTGDALRTTFTK